MAYGSVFADMGAAGIDASAGGGASLDAAYGPATTSNGDHPLKPTSDNGFAWGFWLGVGGLAVLVMIRRSLPA